MVENLIWCGLILAISLGVVRAAVQAHCLVATDEKPAQRVSSIIVVALNLFTAWAVWSVLP